MRFLYRVVCHEFRKIFCRSRFSYLFKTKVATDLCHACALRHFNRVLPRPCGRNKSLGFLKHDFLANSPLMRPVSRAWYPFGANLSQRSKERSAFTQTTAQRIDRYYAWHFVSLLASGAHLSFALDCSRLFHSFKRNSLHRLLFQYHLCIRPLFVDFLFDGALSFQFIFALCSSDRVNY